MTSTETALTEISNSFMAAVGACRKHPELKGEMYKAYAPTFKRLSIEASAIMDHHLGFTNSFSRHLWPAMHLTDQGYLGREIASIAEEALQVIFGGDKSPST